MKNAFTSVLCAVAVLVSGCGPKEGSPKAAAPGSDGAAAPPAPKLLIATDATYPPFEVLDKNGEFTGADIEIGRELGKYLGREVEFQNINFDGLIVALKSGSVDLVISAMTASDARRQSIDFSDPYVKTGLALLVNANSPVQKLEDLKAPGRRVTVRLGTTGEQFASEFLPNTPRVSLDSDTACVLEVTKGGVDAWIYDQLSLMNYHEQNPKSTRVLLKPVREEFWAIGLRKGNDELRGKVNEFLKKYRAEGGFTRLSEKYMAKEKAAMEAQGIPFVYEVGKQE
jgi:polar amino acid transport system substrate-binding protein